MTQIFVKPEEFHIILYRFIRNADDPFSDSSIHADEICDYLLGQVIQGLIEEGKEETASMMLSCRLELEVIEQKSVNSLLPIIHGPVSVVKQLQERRDTHVNESGWTVGPYNRNLDAFYSVLSLVVGPQIILEPSDDIRYQAEIVDLPADWRTELMESIRKKGTTNQGLLKGSGARKPIIYQNLFFRSEAEVKIAKAMDRHKVMYFANCTARLNEGQDRVNREPDFVVCSDGKWGALEVDGEPFHPPSRTVHDHERDRLFHKNGLRFIQHYDANRCYQEADLVVKEFLELLAKSA